jgi:hypothetical protein
MPNQQIPPLSVRLPVAESDGWSLFFRGPPRGPWPKLSGDVYAIAPDGLEVALAWESKGPPLLELSGPSPGRHAVLQVLFPIPVMCENDITLNFREILPVLKQWYGA